MLKLSIITLTLNSERFLKETIASVISQDYVDLEYIIIDGGSTDGTLEIIQNFASTDLRIRWITEPDKGISDAMNKGINLSKGDVIAHLHSDDYYVNSKVISDIVEQFSIYNEALWLTGGIYIVNEEGKILTEVKVRYYSYEKLISGNIILHPATFIKKEVFETVGLFDVHRKFAMDYDLWLRIGAIGSPIVFDKPLAYFRSHQGSLSTAQIDDAFAEEWDIRKKFLVHNPLKSLYHYIRYIYNKRKNRNYLKNTSRELV